MTYDPPVLIMLWMPWGRWITRPRHDHVTDGEEPQRMRQPGSADKAVEVRFTGMWRYQVGGRCILALIKDDELIMVLVDVHRHSAFS